MILQYPDSYFGALIGPFIAAGVISLVISIAMIAWVVKDAKSRGIDPTLWGLLTCFFSWIGCLIYLVTREGNTVTNQQPIYGAPAPGYGAPQPGYGTPAPGYGAPQPGYGTPAPQPGYGTPAPQPGYGAPGGRVCQNCGARVDPAAKFCPSCGSGKIN